MIKRAFDTFYELMVAWGEHRYEQTKKHHNYHWY
jgi:hypothetical protein